MSDNAEQYRITQELSKIKPKKKKYTGTCKLIFVQNGRTDVIYAGPIGLVKAKLKKIIDLKQFYKIVYDREQ
jgi:hypothetical protein